MKRRLLSALLAALLLLPLMAAPVLAAADDSCGYGLTWALADDGTLTISKTDPGAIGGMGDYTSESPAPWDKDAVTRIVINDGVISIGNLAFADCKNLEDITISQSVTKIGTGAFSKCANLTSISIPSQVASIGPYAFEFCGLTSVTIPSGIDTIRYRTFQGCSALKTVTIPKNVVKIEESAFTSSGLETVDYEGSEDDWKKIVIVDPNYSNILLTNLANQVDGGKINYNSTSPDPPDPATYTVTFDVQGGSAVAPATVTSGDKVPKPADPTKSGYTFGGWFKESGCTTAWSFDSDTVTEDMTLFAKWTVDPPNPPDPPTPPDPVIYTVTFDAQGGSAVPQASVTSGDKAAKPADPERSGYTFGGWFKESGCVTPWDFDGDAVTGDMTLYAKWTRRSSGSSGGGGSSGWYTPPAVYPVTIPAQPVHGRLTLSRSSAERGVTVRVTAVPEEGFRLETLKAVGGGKELPLTDEGGGRYAFTMPTGPVKIEAVFAEAESVWVSPYADVAEGAWCYDAVRFVSENGLMSGYGDGQFGVDAPLSRAQLAQILYNKEGRPPAGGEAGFADTVPGAWYSAAVSWAAERGVVSGYTGGRFKPDNPVTREQLAAMLWRYAGSPAPAEGALPFADAGEAGNYALKALSWAAEEGILSGYGDGRLVPRGPATRAQAAKTLWRFLER